MFTLVCLTLFRNILSLQESGNNGVKNSFLWFPVGTLSQFTQPSFFFSGHTYSLLLGLFMFIFMYLFLYVCMRVRIGASVCACWGRRTTSRVFHGSVQLISNEFEMGPLTWDFPSRLGWPTRQQPLQCPRLLVFMFVPLATCTAVSAHWNIPGLLTWVLCVEGRSSTKQSLPLFLCF